MDKVDVEMREEKSIEAVKPPASPGAPLRTPLEEKRLLRDIEEMKQALRDVLIFPFDEESEPSPEEAMDDYLAKVRYLREGLRKMGWMDDEQIAVLILAYFDQVVMG